MSTLEHELETTRKKLAFTQSLLEKSEHEVDILRTKYTTQNPTHADVVAETIAKCQHENEKRSQRVLEILQNKDNEILYLKNENKELNEKINALQEKLSNSRLDDVVDENQMLNKRIKELTKKLNTCKQQLHECETTPKIEPKVVDELEGRITQLTTRMNNEKDIFDQELTRLKEKLKQLNHPNEAKQSNETDAVRVEIQRGRIGELEIEVASLRASLCLAESNPQAPRPTIDMNDNDNKLRRQLDALNQELQQKHTQLLQANRLNMELQTNINTLEQLQETAQKTVIDSERKLDDALHELKQSKTAKNEMDHSVAELYATVEQLQGELNATQDTPISTLRQQLDRRVVDIAKLKEEMNAKQLEARQNTLTLQSEIVSLKSSIQEHKQQMNDLKNQHNLNIKCLEDTVNSLSVRSDIHNELMKARNTVTVLTSELHSSQQYVNNVLRKEEKCEHDLQVQRNLNVELQLKYEELQLKIEKAPELKQCMEFNETIVRLSNELDDYKNNDKHNNNNDDDDDNNALSNEVKERLEVIEHERDVYKLEGQRLEGKCKELERIWNETLMKSNELDKNVLRLKNDQIVSTTAMSTQHLEQLNDLQAQLSTHTRKISTLTRSLKHSTDENQELRKKIKDLYTQKQKHDEQHDESIEKLKNERLTLIEQLNTVREEVATLRAKHAEKQDQIDVLMETIDGLQHHLGLKAAINTSTQQQQHQQHTTTTATTTNKEIHFDHKDEMTKTPEPRQELSRHPPPAAPTTPSIMSTPSSIHSSPTTAAAAMMTDIPLDDHIAQKLLILAAQLCASKGSEASLSRQVYRLQQDLAQHDHIHTELQDSYHAMKNERAKLKAKCDGLETECVKMREKCTKFEYTIGELKEELLTANERIQSEINVISQYKKRVSFLNDELQRIREQHHSELIQERSSQLAQLNIAESRFNTTVPKPTRELIDVLSNNNENIADNMKDIVVKNDVETQKIMYELQAYKWVVEHIMTLWTTTKSEYDRVQLQLRCLQQEFESNRVLTIETLHLKQQHYEQKTLLLADEVDTTKKQLNDILTDSLKVSNESKELYASNMMLSQELKDIRQKHAAIIDDHNIQIHTLKTSSNNTNTLQQRYRDVKDYYDTQLRQLLLSPPHYDRNVKDVNQITAFSISSCLKLNQTIVGLKVIENEQSKRLEDLRNEITHLKSALNHRTLMMKQLEEDPPSSQQQQQQLVVQNNNEDIIKSSVNTIEMQYAHRREILELKLENEELHMIIKRYQRSSNNNNDDDDDVLLLLTKKKYTKKTSNNTTMMTAPTTISPLEEMHHRIISLTEEVTRKSLELNECENELIEYKSTCNDLLKRLNKWENDDDNSKNNMIHSSISQPSRLHRSQTQSHLPKGMMAKLIVEYRMELSRLQREYNHAKQSEAKLLATAERQSKELTDTRTQLVTLQRKRTNISKRSQKPSSKEVSTMQILELNEKNARLQTELIHLKRKYSGVNIGTTKSSNSKSLTRQLKDANKRENELKHTIAKLTRMQQGVIDDDDDDNRDMDPLSHAILGLSRDLHDQITYINTLETTIETLKHDLKNETRATELVDEQKQVISQLHGKLEILTTQQDQTQKTRNSQEEWLNEVKQVANLLSNQYSSSTSTNTQQQQLQPSSSDDSMHIDESLPLSSYLTQQGHNIRARMRSLNNDLRRMNQTTNVVERIRALNCVGNDDMKAFSLFIEHSLTLADRIKYEGKYVQDVMNKVSKKIRSTDTTTTTGALDAHTRELLLNRDYEHEINTLKTQLDELSQSQIHIDHSVELIRQCIVMIHPTNNNNDIDLLNTNTTSLFECTTQLYHMLHDYHSKNHTLNNTISSLKNVNETMQNRMNTLEMQNADQLKRIQEFEGLMNAHDEYRRLNENKINEMNVNLSNIKNENDDLKNRLLFTQNELKGFKEREKKMVTHKNDIERCMNESREKCIVFEAQLNDLKNAKNLVDNELTQLKQRENNLHTQQQQRLYDHNEEMKQLKDKLNHSLDTLHLCEKQRNELQDENMTLSNDLKGKTIEINELRNQVNEYEVTLKTQLTNAQNTHAQMMSAYEAHVNELKNQLNLQVKRQNKSSKNTTKNSKRSNNNNQRVSELLAKLAGRDATISQLRLKIAQQRPQLSSSSHVQDDTKQQQPTTIIENSRIHGLEMQIALFEQEKNALQSQCITLQNQLEISTNETRESIDRYNQLQKNFDRKTQESSHEYKLLQQKVEDVESIRKERQKLQQEHTRLNDMVHEFKLASKVARDDIHRKNKLIESYKEKINILETNVNDLNEKLQKKTIRLQSASKRKRRQQDHKHATSNNNTHKYCIEKYKQYAQKQQEKFKNIQYDLDNKSKYIHELKAKINDLEERIENERGKSNDKVHIETIRKLRNELSRKTTQIQQCKSKINRLESISDELMNERESLKQQVSTLDGKLYAAKSRIHALKNTETPTVVEPVSIVKIYEVRLTLMKRVIIDLVRILCHDVVRMQFSPPSIIPIPPPPGVKSIDTSVISNMSLAVNQFSADELRDIMGEGDVTATTIGGGQRKRRWNGRVPAAPATTSAMYDVYNGIQECLDTLCVCINEDTQQQSREAPRTIHTILTALMKLIDQRQ